VSRVKGRSSQACSCEEAPEGAQEAAGQRAAQRQAGLEPLAGEKPVRRRVRVHRQAAGATGVRPGGHQRAAECLHARVRTVRMGCPSIRHGSNSRNKHMRRMVARESNERESEEAWGLCGSCVQSLSLTRTSPRVSLTGFQWSFTTEKSGPLSP